MFTTLLKIEGKVQGVFYRQATMEKASALGITGTVRNCQDQTVEIVATGTKWQLDEFTNWCWIGPPKAVVTAISLQELTLQSFNNFSVIR